jgi:hypothetical protein
LEYARTYYKDRIQDFSDNSLGGVFLDFAAYVGDVMSYYLDHQFTELDPTTAVETQNIQNILRKEGVEIVGASPAVVNLLFGIEIPAQFVNNVAVPSPSCLPIILEGSIAEAQNGVEFITLESIDFSETKTDGSLVCNVSVGDTDSNGIPTTFLLSREVLSLSGYKAQETFSIGSFVPFREISLSNPNVTMIESVYDSLGNTYYQVRSLTQDVVYKGLPNPNIDNDIVDQTLEIIPAPYRFSTKVSLDTRTTTLVMGGGSADTINDDVIPDPTTFALPLYGKQTFSRISINPQQLINTRTLGVAAPSVTLYVNYRYGGGLSHNAEPKTINNVKT